LDTMIDDLALLPTKRAAELLGFTPTYMRKLRSVGGGPDYVKVSARNVCYRVADLRAWLDARTHTRSEDERLARAKMPLKKTSTGIVLRKKKTH
jgi:hypothetical protein